MHRVYRVSSACIAGLVVDLAWFWGFLIGESGPVCDLVTHPGVTPGIWDCDACTLEHPVIVKDDDLDIQEVEDAMRLEDSSSLKAR